MRKIVFLLAWLTCARSARRVRPSTESLQKALTPKSKAITSHPFERSNRAQSSRQAGAEGPFIALKAFARLLLKFNLAAAFNFCSQEWQACGGNLQNRIGASPLVMGESGELTGYSNVPGDFSSRLFADDSENKQGQNLNADVSPSAPKVQPKAVPARLLVLDTLLPGQRLRCEAAPPEFRALVENSGESLVVVGRNRFFLLARGVEVVVQIEGDEVVLETTGRLAELVEFLSADDDDKSRWAGQIADVRWLGRLEDDDSVLSPDDEYNKAKAIDHAGYVGLEEGPERLAKLSESLGSLADEWVGLVRATSDDQCVRKLDSVLKDLGQMPTEPNARAVYVAALVSSLSPLGFAMDIRPAIITATGTSKRLTLAQQGLNDSTERLKKPTSDV